MTAVRARTSAKVILLDEHGRTLLFRGGDPSRPAAGTWWFPPGGGVEPGETLEQAARRELSEEVGIEVGDLGAPVMHTDVEFDFEDVQYRQTEHYFLVRVSGVAVDASAWTDIERRVIVEHRWWSVDELTATEATVYPEGLKELITRALQSPS